LVRAITWLDIKRLFDALKATACRQSLDLWTTVSLSS
jgi:hypothetical protein